MFQTLSTSQAADLLKADTNAAWTRSGAYAIVEHLEQSEETNYPIEFDAVAIRCDYSEYSSAYEAAIDYGFKAEYEDEDGRESEAMAWLGDRTEVIAFCGGVVVGKF